MFSPVEKWQVRKNNSGVLLLFTFGDATSTASLVEVLSAAKEKLEARCTHVQALVRGSNWPLGLTGKPNKNTSAIASPTVYGFLW